jgi:hypothetical protein
MGWLSHALETGAAEELPSVFDAPGIFGNGTHEVPSDG